MIGDVSLNTHIAGSLTIKMARANVNFHVLTSKIIIIGSVQANEGLKCPQFLLFDYVWLCTSEPRLKIHQIA